MDPERGPPELAPLSRTAARNEIQPAVRDGFIKLQALRGDPVSKLFAACLYPGEAGPSRSLWKFPRT